MDSDGNVLHCTSEVHVLYIHVQCKRFLSDFQQKKKQFHLFRLQTWSAQCLPPWGTLCKSSRQRVVDPRLLVWLRGRPPPSGAPRWSPTTTKDRGQQAANQQPFPLNVIYNDSYRTRWNACCACICVLIWVTVARFLVRFYIEFINVSRSHL